MQRAGSTPEIAMTESLTRLNQANPRREYDYQKVAERQAKFKRAIGCQYHT
jgi:hypothetical protein